MSNSYYNHSTYPAPNSAGSSAQLRAELELITSGFNKLPTLTGNANKVAVINSTGDALVASAALQALQITGSTIDSTPIGATTRAAGNFTSLSANGAVGLGTAVTIGGGTIDGTIIGGTTRAAGYFTTLAVASGITANITGNVTGNLTGNVTGNVTGDVTGNVTASTGTSTFNNVTINGTLDMNAGSGNTITGLSAPTNGTDAATKTYVDTADALKLNLAGGTMSGAIAMGTNKITGLGDPTAAQDAATKNYVDNLVQGLDAKPSVRAATTANITLSGTQTIDGVVLVANDRVLVKDQTTQSANGIYVVAAGAWTRATDADTWAELVSAYVFVEEGTANGDNGWVCTVNAGGTLGTTNVTFVQFSGAGQITAGAGLTKTGNTLDVGTASTTRIVVNADNIDLATTGVTASTYRSVTVDVYGRVTAGTNPTTLSGYGITDAYTTAATDSLLNAKLSLAGGTMTGAIAMSANKITGMADPTLAQDAATKNYIDTIFGSTTSAAASASAAATSATNAANSATAAGTSATNAATSATNAASSYTTFNNQYLGSKTANPTLNNTGGALVAGNLYWNSTALEMRVYNGTAWVSAYLPAGSYVLKAGDTMTGALALGTSSTTTGLNNTLNITGGTSANQYVAGGSIQSDVTATATGYQSFIGTAAAAFTLNSLIHFRAGNGGVGAGSTVTNQYGFYYDAAANLGTNNYAFYGNLAAATGRWNLYMAGTAPNYLAGNLVMGGGGIQEFRTAMGANDINLSAGNYFTKTVSTTTTLTVSNVPAAGTVASFILDLTNGGTSTVTWFTGVKWALGAPPTLTVAGRDVLGFFTHDGGTTWTGFLLAKDAK